MVSLKGFLRRAQARSLRLHRLIEELMDPSPASPALIHDLHRELRRARIDARVLRRTLPKPLRAPLRELERALEDLTTAAGEVRDRDVLEGALERLARGASASPAVAREARSLARALHREGNSWRGELRRSARRGLRGAHGHLPGLAPGAHATPGSSEKGAQGFPRADRALARRFQRAIDRELGDAERDLERARRRAQRKATVRRLHRLRIHLRRFRHLHTSIARDPGRADVSAEWRELQRDLGLHHDLGVLEERLAASPGNGPRHRLRKVLRGELERHRSRAVRRISAVGRRSPTPA